MKVMNHRRAIPSVASATRQHGAVLYVALIMLILLALIGIVGMQVTGLQEKMSANYRASNLAFQNAEASARAGECYLESLVNRTVPVCDVVDISPICDDGFDATSWADTTSKATSNVRSIGQCISGEASLSKGKAPVSEDPNPVYQITTYPTDFKTDATASAAVDTIFRP